MPALTESVSRSRQVARKAAKTPYRYFDWKAMFSFQNELTSWRDASKLHESFKIVFPR